MWFTLFIVLNPPLFLEGICLNNSGVVEIWFGGGTNNNGTACRVCVSQSNVGAVVEGRAPPIYR